MNKKIEGIAVGIAVKDVNEAVEWYTRLFGDVEVIEPSPGTVELRLTDDAWLQLDDTGHLTVGGPIIRFETKDIYFVHTVVKELAPDAGNIETVDGVIKYFDFQDPAGNRLSYYQLI